MTVTVTALAIQKPCDRCGKPVDPKYKLCYKCLERERLTFQNRCPNCGKPIDNKYRLCYQCYQKELKGGE